MIKVKAVSGKIFNELSDEYFFSSATASDKSSLRCPVCGRKGAFKKIHPYDRCMITIDRSCSERKETIVSIPRIYCPSCRHTHALLPDNLIPFGSYTIRFVLEVLSEYLKKVVPVTTLCDRYGISISTLYHWKKLLTYHHSLLLGIMHVMDSLCEKIISDITGFESLPEVFFSTFRFSFLQNHTTFSGHAPCG